MLPPAHKRRLPLLDLPIKMLARVVAYLILASALERATPPDNLRKRAPGTVRALLRTGVKRHLTNAHGDYDLAQIARTCANPEAAIADMAAALTRGLTRRSPILAQSACDALGGCAPLTTAHALDSS